MSVKTYQLYCEICGYKRISDGSDVHDLLEIKTSPIPGGVPFVDPQTKKIIVPKSQNQRKKFRCPKCGRIIMARQIQTTEYIQDEQVNNTDGSKTSTEGPSIQGESSQKSV
jgi:predicted RNA-binding Zn-ribbon protein involved in translation (DUF1610 family)